MFTIGICDDDKAVQSLIREHINLFFADKGDDYKVVDFSNGKDLLTFIESKDETIEMLFLDIEMPGDDGITIKELLEKNDKVERIVFATSHYENMQKAFGLKLVGFLVKPIISSDINKRLKDCYEEYVSDKLLPISEDKFIKESQISYIKSEGNYCDIYLTNGESIKAIRNTLSNYKKTLGEPFIQIHRSYLINACDVKKADRSRLILSNGVELPIGRYYVNSFRESYKEIAIKRARGRI